MTDHAIVIGIDAYPDPARHLFAAVRDAERFATWVTAPGAGRATAATLTLLLSPRAGVPAPALPFRPATRANIHAAIAPYLDKGHAADADRLWFFYAGHAVAQPNAQVDTPPVMVAADEGRPMKQYLDDNPLPLSRYIDALRARPSGIQLFFVDACRVAIESDDAFTNSTSVVIDLAKLAGTADQAMIFASTSGKTSAERGLHGYFSRALIEGLDGRGGLVVDEDAGDFVVTVANLGRFVKRRVGELSQAQGRPDAVQVPSPVYRGELSELPLARFTPAQRPRATLEVLVEPAPARAEGRGAIVTRDPLTAEYRYFDRRDKPLPLPVAWDLPTGEHRVEIAAPGFAPVVTRVQLVESLQLEVTLRPPSGFETIQVLGLESLAAGALGHLRVVTPDVLARIEVFGPDGRSVHVDRGALVRRNLPVGSYRVEVVLPGLPLVERVVDVERDLEATCAVTPPPASPALAGVLASLQMRPVGGVAQPSPAFGDATWSMGAGGLGSTEEPEVVIATTVATHIGSLLAWAASAAPWNVDDSPWLLRQVDLPQLPGGDVLVLVGDLVDDRALHQIALAYGAPGAEQPVALTAIPSLGTLAQVWSGAGVDGAGLRIDAPGLVPTAHLPLAGVPGHVSVVVIAREADARVEIHRYLVRAIAVPGERFTDAIRVAEDGWRALEAGRRFLPGEAEALVARDDLDPLALAVLGFRLRREDRLDLLGAGDDDLVLARMLHHGAALPDLHVLAALVAAGDRPAGSDAASAAAMARAAAAGTPILRAAQRELAAWSKARGVAVPDALAASVWSMVPSEEEPHV